MQANCRPSDAANGRCYDGRAPLAEGNQEANGMTTKGQMRLGAFFNPTGHHVASWRHPQAQADAGINFKHYAEITQTAERAKFDMVFFADNLCVREANMEALSRSAQYIANFEPLTLLAALSSVTRHRARGDCLHELQRAVPCGAQVCLHRS